MSERNRHTEHWCARQKKNPGTLHVFYVLASLKFAFDYCSFTLYSLVLLPSVCCLCAFFRRVVLLSKPQLIFLFRLLQTIDSLSFFIPCLRFKQLRFYTIFVYSKSVWNSFAYIHQTTEIACTHKHIHNVEHKANCSKYTNENIQNRQRHQNRTKQRKICDEKNSIGPESTPLFMHRFSSHQLMAACLLRLRTH